jgi:hypothetical protein
MFHLKNNKPSDKYTNICDHYKYMMDDSCNKEKISNTSLTDIEYCKVLEQLYTNCLKFQKSKNNIN